MRTPCFIGRRNGLIFFPPILFSWSNYKISAAAQSAISIPSTGNDDNDLWRRRRQQQNTNGTVNVIAEAEQFNIISFSLENNEGEGSSPSSSNISLSLPQSSQSSCPLNCKNNSTCVRGEMDTSSHPFDPSNPDEPLEFHKNVSKDGWYCDCPPGLTGLECDRKYQICENATDHVCYNGGKCLDGLQELYGPLELFCGCFPQTDSDGITRFYSGKYCEKEIIKEPSHCIDDDVGDFAFCKNGGKCSLYSDDVNPCDCAEGFTGKHCEYSTSTVANCNLPCGNGGACRLGTKDVDPLLEKFEVTHLDYLYCECLDGFTGNFCEFPTNTCGDEFVCLRGATCHQNDQTNEYSCDCNSISNNEKVFAGKHCQYESTSMCHPGNNGIFQTYCMNEGACPTEPHLPCFCRSGYSGPHCEFTEKELNHQDKNAECSLQCENGGTCQKGLQPQIDDIYGLDADFAHMSLSQSQDQFEHCNCPIGFMGSKCEYDYVTCNDGHPCFYGSTCSHVNGEPTCACAKAHQKAAGKYCQHVANEVCTNETQQNLLQASSPDEYRGFCVNGGRCIRNDQGIQSCICPHRYKGDHCEYFDGSSSLIDDTSLPAGRPQLAKERNESGTSSINNNLSLGAQFAVALTVLVIILGTVYGVHEWRRRQLPSVRLEQTTGGFHELNPTLHHQTFLDSDSEMHGPVVNTGPIGNIRAPPLHCFPARTSNICDNEPLQGRKPDTATEVGTFHDVEVI